MKLWIGETTCNYCKKERPKHIYDAPTVHGPWALMCTTCYRRFGVDIASGVGQHYTLAKEGEHIGKYIKVETKPRKRRGADYVKGAAMLDAMLRGSK